MVESVLRVDVVNIVVLEVSSVEELILDVVLERVVVEFISFEDVEFSIVFSPFVVTFETAVVLFVTFVGVERVELVFSSDTVVFSPFVVVFDTFVALIVTFVILDVELVLNSTAVLSGSVVILSSVDLVFSSTVVFSGRVDIVFNSIVTFAGMVKVLLIVKLGKELRMVDNVFNSTVVLFLATVMFVVLTFSEGNEAFRVVDISEFVDPEVGIEDEGLYPDGQTQP